MTQRGHWESLARTTVIPYSLSVCEHAKGNIESLELEPGGSGVSDVLGAILTPGLHVE